MELLNSAALIGVQSSDLTSGIGNKDLKGGKLHNAAQQFEALMMEEMLKVTRETSSEGWLGSGDGTGDDSAMDMAQSQLAQALSSHGGLGLAKIIEQRLGPAMDRHGQSAAPQADGVDAVNATR
jgi:Rod binding domain-containing protein